jgi:hypothetical protein
MMSSVRRHFRRQTALCTIEHAFSFTWRRCLSIARPHVSKKNSCNFFELECDSLVFAHTGRWLMHLAACIIIMYTRCARGTAKGARGNKFLVGCNTMMAANIILDKGHSHTPVLHSDISLDTWSKSIAHVCCCVHLAALSNQPRRIRSLSRALYMDLSLSLALSLLCVYANVDGDFFHPHIMCVRTPTPRVYTRS